MVGLYLAARSSKLASRLSLLCAWCLGAWCTWHPLGSLNFTSAPLDERFLVFTDVTAGFVWMLQCCSRFAAPPHVSRAAVLVHKEDVSLAQEEEHVIFPYQVQRVRRVIEVAFCQPRRIVLPSRVVKIRLWSMWF